MAQKDSQGSGRSWAWLVERFATVDSRALGVFRIVFGVLLLTNLVDRAWGSDLTAFYSNEGMLPNHFALYLPLAHGYWSVLSGFSTTPEVRVAFAAMTAIYLLYTVGYFTRVMQVLVVVCVLSLNFRFLLVQHGGNVVLAVLSLWSLLLPVGDRFSVDALLRSLRRHDETSPTELATKAFRASTPKVHVGLAVLGANLNFAFIYFFNALQKSGVSAWQDGSMVHWVLWQNRIATHLADFIRDHEPRFFSPMLTWGTLVMEWALPFCIMAPVWQHWARIAAFLQVVALHLGIAVISTLGCFSYVMMTYACLLWPAWLFERGTPWLRRVGQGAEVKLDFDDGTQRLAARVLARMDLLDRVRFTHQKGAEFSARAESSKEFSTQGAAADVIARALPLGVLVGWLFRLPVVGPMLVWLAVMKARVFFEWFSPRPLADATPQRETLASAVRFGLAAFLLVVLGQQLLLDNWSVPREWKPFNRPKVFDTFVQHFQFSQGWSMFTPGIPTTDARLVVDAVLTDGRHIDLFTGQPPDFEPGRRPFYMNQQWCEVHARLPNWGAHFRNVRDYLWRLPQLERWPQGLGIVSFDVYSVTWNSPAFGSLEPYGWQRRKLFDQGS